MFNKIIFKISSLKIVGTAILFAVIPVIFFVAQAAEFTSIGSIKFNQSNDTTPFYRITVKATEPDEITMENGLNFILPKPLAIQWSTKNNGNITLSGTAAHKVDPDPTFLGDLYILHLNVNENFAEGEEVHINGLTPITYRKSVASRPLGLDINGDQQQDMVNIYHFLVKDIERGDTTAPNMINNFKAEYNANKKVVNLNWDKPPEYDIQWVAVDKEVTVNGKKTRSEIYKGNDITYIDSNITTKEVRYFIYTSDTANNLSGSVDITIQTDTATEEEVTTPETTTTEETTTPSSTTTTEDTEKTELKQFLNYYDIRYQIKCLTTDAKVDDDPCLFAKVDLLYAQEKLGEIKEKISLASNEIALLSSRIKWAELRYKTQCTEATVPAKFCESLQDGIQRTKYFIHK